MLYHGADINVVVPGGRGPLVAYLASRSDLAEEDQPEMVEFLLTHAADVNATDEHNNSALIEAACGGNVSVVVILLRHKADVGIRNDHGNSALDCARNVEVLEPDRAALFDEVQKILRVHGALSAADPH